MNDKQATPTEQASPEDRGGQGVRGWKRGFWSLFLTQFQGAFSDNVFKFLVIFLVASAALSSDSLIRPDLLLSRLRERADPVSQHLWDRLPADTQERMRLVSEAEATGSLFSSELALGLNQAMEAGPFYASNVFEAVALSEDTRRLLENPEDRANLPRLNRLLLEDAYPEAVVNSRQQRDRLMPVVLAVFALPFILFSMAGGFLADRFSKRDVTMTVKVAEMGIMSLGTVGLFLQSIPVLIGVVFLMSAQSAIFGPSKYGLLPQMLPERQLSWGNGILGLGTFVAIIAGGVVAGILSDWLGPKTGYAGFFLIALAVAGWSASLGICRLPPANPAKQFKINFLGDLWTQLKRIRKDRVLSLAIVGSTYFWFLGALFDPTILIYGQDLLDLTDSQCGYLRASLAIGIGVGSAAAGYLSGKKIEYGLVPLGSMGMALFGLLLARPGLGFTQAALLLGSLGFFGGFFIVPINALIQHRPNTKNKGAVIGTNAWLSSLGIFLAAGVFGLLKNKLGFDPSEIFVLGSLLTLAGTVYVTRLIPDSLLRLLIWLLTHSLYRIQVVDRDNLPAKGGALLVSNHLSLADALLLQSSTDRPIRFLMFTEIYERRLVKPFARVMRAIPISSRQRPREMLGALEEAAESLRHGEVVCIFAEGQITRIGHLLPFRRGFERIMNQVQTPIVPVCLEGVWGSIFSFERGRFIWKMPRRFPHPVSVLFGSPLPSDADHVTVRRAVQDLEVVGWKHRRRQMRPLHRSFIAMARRNPFRFAMGDAQSPRVRFGALLTRCLFLARRLNPHWEGQSKVGILLPPSVPCALVNLAALLTGRIPVNLNYTVSADVVDSCIQQSDIRTVVTSAMFLKRLKLSLKTPVIHLEEMARRPRLSEKLKALIAAWLLPARLLERSLGLRRQVSLDDLATIIFSSGSTGDPKGVMLTHYNIQSNVEQIGQLFALGRRDALLGTLPFFHSFGFTGTLALPVVLGTGVVYHFSPLDAARVGELVRDYAVTFLLTTPTFLQLYQRSCSPEDFGSLQYVVAGAEKLPERLVTAFEDKFGIRPLEGYGCTECAPVVAVNSRDYRGVGIRQVGAKRGRIGHPLPGISVRIVDPQTGEPLPLGEAGLLLVRGPNVMKGYLNRPEQTAEVLRDGWYTTGDVAAQDEDGFLQITDRLSRFSKIGGEMVPHVRVEEALHDLLKVADRCLVVTAVPDERKGERLVVLHTLSAEVLEQMISKLSQAELPNLWVPRADQFYSIAELPVLGTGKLDLRKVKALAAELAAA